MGEEKCTMKNKSAGMVKARSVSTMKEVRKKVGFRPDSASVAKYRNIKREKHIFDVTRSR